MPTWGRRTPAAAGPSRPGSSSGRQAHGCHGPAPRGSASPGGRVPEPRRGRCGPRGPACPPRPKGRGRTPAWARPGSPPARRSGAARTVPCESSIRRHRHCTARRNRRPQPPDVPPAALSCQSGGVPYRERAPYTAPLLALAALAGASFGLILVPLSVPVAAVVSTLLALACVAFALVASPLIEVDVAGFRAGPARIEGEFLGAVETLDKEAIRRAMGVDADARAYLCH